MSMWSGTFFLDSCSLFMMSLVDFYDNVMIILSLILVLVGLNIIFVLYSGYIDRIFIQDNFIEVVWTLVPAFMLFFIAVPSLEVLYMMEDYYKFHLVIKSIGYQWYWSYEYSDFMDLDFDSYMVEDKYGLGLFRLLEVDNSLVIPSFCNICVIVTGGDVIHSWVMPSLGLKADCVPGRLSQLFFNSMRSGIFYGQCSEICGVNHSFMPIKMEVVPMNYFKSWVMSNN